MKTIEGIKTVNLAMLRKVIHGEACDLSKYPRDAEGNYVLNKAWDRDKLVNSDMDFCDLETERWIWSIGLLDNGDIVAATDSRHYGQPYECLWLR